MEISTRPVTATDDTIWRHTIMITSAPCPMLSSMSSSVSAPLIMTGSLVYFYTKGQQAFRMNSICEPTSRQGESTNPGKVSERSRLPDVKEVHFWRSISLTYLTWCWWIRLTVAWCRNVAYTNPRNIVPGEIAILQASTSHEIAAEIFRNLPRRAVFQRPL
jgi:hypothetical protein